MTAAMGNLNAASEPAGAIAGEARAPKPLPSVGVVVPAYNHAHFLHEALESIVGQTRPSDALIVVDDGSTDHPEQVVARFPGVGFLRQENRGLAAARNAGLASLDTTFVVFLDADDRLEPQALELGLACFKRAPDSGFVYGGHFYIDAAGNRIGERFEPAGDDPYLRLLGGNFIAMHGTVMYRRDRLLEIGGFDERLRRCEDYDVFLRMARTYPITGYDDLVASYRLHDGNMSANHGAMLTSALEVLKRHAPPRAADSRLRQAWRDGRRRWRRSYASAMSAARYRRRQQGLGLRQSLPMFFGTAAAAPGVALGEAARGARRRLASLLPGRLAGALVRRRDRVPPSGRVRLGDFDRVTPISRDFGFDRGTPVDRYYIEQFLARQASEIWGRVLEIGDATYTRQFGGTRVARSDVLHVHAANPQATLVGDLSEPALPEAAFDCMIITQTLQLIYDVRLAIQQMHRGLAPGGVALITAPGISQIDRGEWGSRWCWSFTARSLERLFAEVFGPRAVTVEQYGNVLAAVAFLHGLAVEEIDVNDLQSRDPSYPVIIGVRARKAENSR